MAMACFAGMAAHEGEKGVYMDGHERLNVVEYQNNVFLPLMASFERRMAQWIRKPEYTELVHIEPALGPDEKQIIAIFQDESCFHVNDHKQTMWYTLCLFLETLISCS
jgi:hypothetical protein